MDSNSSDSKTKQCEIFLSGQCPKSDISYANYVSKDENLAFLCSTIQVGLKEIDKSINSHDFRCEYLLLKMITDTDNHRQKQVKLQNTQINKFNRYSNVVPYEFNTITLPDKSYINASLITGPFDSKIIAAQNPLESTINSFWLMIIHQNISFIVFLSFTFEESNDKYVQYWPKDSTPIYIKDGNKRYLVKLTSTIDIINKYEIKRDFEITLEGDLLFKLKVEQYHVNCWEEHSVPMEQTAFKVIDDLINNMEDNLQMNNNPVLVHCNDGIGRTGTFIAIFNIIKCLMVEKKEGNKEPIFNVFNVVRRLREERYGMVTDASEYKYIYDFLKKWLHRFYDL